MEAEWELIRLESDGIIDGVVSEDSDRMVLGSKLVVQLQNKSAAPSDCDCTLVYGTHWYDLIDQDVISSPRIAERADFAVLMGCDYLPRAFGNSIAKIQSFSERWRSDRGLVLAEIESLGQVGGKRMRNGLPGNSHRFDRA